MVRLVLLVPCMKDFIPGLSLADVLLDSGEPTSKEAHEQLKICGSPHLGTLPAQLLCTCYGKSGACLHTTDWLFHQLLKVFPP